MTIYYRGTEPKKINSGVIVTMKLFKHGKFYTKSLKEAQSYGAIVETAEINPKNPLILGEKPGDTGIDSLTKKWGVYGAFDAMRKKGDVMGWQDLINKEAYKRGYDSVVTGDWIVVLDDRIVKRKAMTRYEYHFLDYVSDIPNDVETRRKYRVAMRKKGKVKNNKSPKSVGISVK